MILALILAWGIATLWVPGRWAVAVFQIALFLAAAFRIVRTRRPHRLHPITWLLLAAAAWGVVQIVMMWSVDKSKTVDAVLGWLTNAAAFALAVEEFRQPDRRDRFLLGLLTAGVVLSLVAILTAVTSPPGRVFWTFDIGSDLPTLGPFVYRNQYAAFVEVLLPVALVRAILDPRRWVTYTLAAATLFGSVVAGGSRTGSILCAAEILTVPVLIYARHLISARTLMRALAGSIAAAALLTAVVGWETIWQRLQEPNPYSLRRELVRSSAEMVRDRPLTGFGLGTWSSAYPAYAHFDDGRFVNQAHNDWIQWTAEGGVPFVLLIFAIAVWSVRPASRSLWGIGILFVFVHCLVDYPMQQRPALAAFFFAILGVIATLE